MRKRHRKKIRSTSVAVVAIGAAALAAALQAREMTPQVNEANTQTRSLVAAGQTATISASASQVCQPGAKWLRLNFESLTLGAYDSLEIRSSGGDRFVFQGNGWNDRSFTTRSLRGECIDIQPYLASSTGYGYALKSLTYGDLPLTATPPAAVQSSIVAGAGDICDSEGDACVGTGGLIGEIAPSSVFTAGDSAYESGTLAEYRGAYARSWGAYKDKTKPTPGNHDYAIATSASGYFDYFNGEGVQTGLAGDRSKGYYSWDNGDWHFVALNTMTGEQNVADTQLAWLEQDLKATTKPCIAAYFHHPLISMGHYAPVSGQTRSYPEVQKLYDMLYAGKVDLVLVGHDHNYQRYRKMNSSLVAANDGFRQVLVGTGGRLFYDVTKTHPMLEVKNGNTYGVLKLTLSATGYTGQFVRSKATSNPGTFTDTFSDTCNVKPNVTQTNALPTADFTPTVNDLTVALADISKDTDGTIVRRVWDFGDGVASEQANPSHTYAEGKKYTIKLTVTDDKGGTNTISKDVLVPAPLTKGVAKTGAGAATGNALYYKIDVPEGATNLVISTSGGTGDADLYVKAAGDPLVGTSDCKGDLNGNAEKCTIAAPAKATYYIALKAYATFSGAAIVADYTPAATGGGTTPSPTPACGGTVLCSGTAVSLESVASGKWLATTYTINVPAGKTSVAFSISGGTGDADLYVNLGSAATSTVSSAVNTSTNCAPYLDGNNETCTMTPPAAGGTYYVRVYAYSGISGVSLKATILP